MKNRKRFRLLWVGKTKERFIAQGIEKYRTLLEPLAAVEIIEVKEAKGGAREQRMRREAERILARGEPFVLLHAGGGYMTSEDFARFLEQRMGTTFLIGGPFGVSPDVEEKAELKISLSPMTFTHEMTRVLLLEQIYRAMTILKGMRYHH